MNLYDKALYESIMKNIGNIVRHELECQDGYYCSRPSNRLYEDDQYQVDQKLCKTSLYKDLQGATQERTVERAYSTQFERYLKNGTITYPHSCDGYISDVLNGQNLRMIMEFKIGRNLKNRMEMAKVLLQVIYYLYRFDVNNDDMPNVCFIGDEDECFVMHTNPLIKYIDRPEIDWSIEPSQACFEKANMPVLRDIAQDKDMDILVLDVDQDFKFCDVDQAIYNLVSIDQRYINVNEKNISKIFNIFCEQVLMDSSKLNAHELVDVFIGAITDPVNYYVNPNSSCILVANGKQVRINQRNFNGFFKMYSRKYTIEEKRRFSEIADRLIADTERRNKGDFFTPTPFVNYAQDMISKTFGEDWRSKYVVWDCACGTKNLTRDYRFKELYCSTLEQSELNISAKYNTNSVAFQFDFLNDPLEGNLMDGCKLPKGLQDALRGNKPIMFFINPPYATANNLESDGSSKEKVAKTLMNIEMTKNGWGAASQNLYAQFLYRITQIKRIYNLNNVVICIFCPTLFLTGPSYEQFRIKFFKNFGYINGVQFKASEFSDVADNWGIGFTIWQNGETHDVNNFDILNIHNEQGKIIEDNNKEVYNMDGVTKANDWAKEPIKRIKTNQDFPQVTSGLKIKQDGLRGSSIPNSLGYIFNNSNNVDMNAQKVALFSTAYGNGNGFNINKDNFTRCTSLFSARRLITCNWQNSADEYMAPDTTSKYWQEFENDSIIYSLFEAKSNQSSLRQVEYHNKLWDIKNEFFWMPISSIKALANKYGNDECYEDCQQAQDERYVYKLLQGGLVNNLSQEAQDVLDDAIDLVNLSFEYRQDFNDEHPEYQINNWDCGYYQLKALWKEYFPNEFDAFRAKVKALGDKMRPMVYQVGFLKQ